MKEPIKMTAHELYNNLLSLNLQSLKGYIKFSLADVDVTINTTDTVGITLQSWLKQYLLDNNIYFSEPTNTQEFPDFFLDDINKNRNILEIKAFNYNASPAFDIANFDSYCLSVSQKPYRLDADYIIFGYLMSSDGSISIPKIWIKKIWEIAGTSTNYKLKTQVKKNVIYNIRPNTQFKSNSPVPFKSKNDFIKAIYETLKKYKSDKFAEDWLIELSKNYNLYYNEKLVL